MLELGKQSLLLEAVSIACNNLACLAKSAAREEAQQKVVNLIALKTPEQEGEAKVPEETDLQNLAERGPVPDHHHQCQGGGAAEGQEPDCPQDT